ncbi:MAG: V-type ATP synthase subunit D [Patescibacteria group bacterium UBA2163]
MAELKVNPTRINLLKLKAELKVAKRGHKLLKDKRDGLMREFMAAVKDVRALRKEVNSELIRAFEGYISASALMDEHVLNNAFTHYDTSVGGVDIDVRQVMSVSIPSFTPLEREEVSLPYGYLESYGNLDTAMHKLKHVYPRLIKLAELESSVERLAREIERTRRRASALENIRIPLLTNTIRTIYLRLEEQARDAVVSTMRVKALITKGN